MVDHFACKIARTGQTLPDRQATANRKLGKKSSFKYGFFRPTLTAKHFAEWPPLPARLEWRAARAFSLEFRDCRHGGLERKAIRGRRRTGRYRHLHALLR